MYNTAKGSLVKIWLRKIYIIYTKYMVAVWNDILLCKVGPARIGSDHYTI